MISDYALLISMIKKANEDISKKIDKFLTAIPLGIKKAMKAQRPDCVVKIKNKTWIYVEDPDGVYLSTESDPQMPGDEELALMYTNDDLVEIEPGYRALMASYNNVFMVVRKGENRTTETNYYDFEITKLSETKFKVNVLLSTNNIELQEIASTEIDFEKDFKQEEETCDTNEISEDNKSADIKITQNKDITSDENIEIKKDKKDIPDFTK